MAKDYRQQLKYRLYNILKTFCLPLSFELKNKDPLISIFLFVTIFESSAAACKYAK